MATEEPARRWIEEIRLRTADTERESVIERLAELSSVDEQPAAEISIYANGRVDTDLCVHIRWHGREVPASGTLTGVRIADELRAHGIIQHTVWRQVCPARSVSSVCRNIKRLEE
ncbi:hypothetical protein [Salinispira pacifica]